MGPAQPTPAEEIEKVALLLKEVKAAGAWDDAKHDEYILRRCLRAREWSLEAAKTLFLNIVQWRTDWDVEGYLKREILTPAREKRFRELFPHGLHGVDNMGRPVMYYRIGKAECAALMEEFPELTRQQVHAQLMEFITRVAMPSCSVASGSRVDKMTTVYDLQGIAVNMANMYGQLLTPPTRITGAYYPDLLAQLLIVNAPMMFDTVFAVSKRMLAPSTQKKIQVLGARATANRLTDFIQLDQLPEFLGGSSRRPITDNWGPWTDMAAEEVAEPEAPHSEPQAEPLHIDDVTVSPANKTATPEFFAVNSSRFARNSGSASFHSCLSSAESAFLRSFLATPSAARGFTPGLGATFCGRDHVSTIQEETTGGLSTNTIASQASQAVPSTPKKPTPKQPSCCPWLCGGGRGDD